MVTGNISLPDWRNEPGLYSNTSYKKRFALWPVKISDGNKIWLKTYYSKYTIIGHCSIHSFDMRDHMYVHTDFVEHISEAEYLVRKLAENL